MPARTQWCIPGWDCPFVARSAECVQKPHFIWSYEGSGLRRRTRDEWLDKVTRSLVLSRVATVHHALNGIVDLIEDVGASQQTGFTVL
jgi:hypothetical protein